MKRVGVRGQVGSVSGIEHFGSQRLHLGPGRKDVAPGFGEPGGGDGRIAELLGQLLQKPLGRKVASIAGERGFAEEDSGLLKRRRGAVGREASKVLEPTLQVEL